MKRLLEVVLNAEGTFGGAQKHVAQVLAGLDPDRYTGEVITWDIPLFVDHLRRMQVETLPVTGSRILDVGMIRRLAAHIKARGYDLVHTHGHRAGFIGRLAAIRAGVPAIVWTCHGIDNKADRNAVSSVGYGMALRWLAAHTDRHVAVSSGVRDWLIKKGVAREEIEVVHNCVDLDEFRPRPGRSEVIESLGLQAEPARPIVGTISRLADKKGLDCLIDAARLVLNARPETQFVVVGGGPLLKELTEQADKLGVADNVVFAGERDGIPNIVATFDIAVLPSHSEGFSYVPLEVMASRKPLICSDIDSFREVVTDGRTGLVFPVGSAGSLADAILRLLANPAEAERFAKEGHNLVQREFALSTMQRRTVDIYEDVLRRQKSS